MKTKNKLILTSLAMIAVAGGIAGGATYALFTSQDSANVAINSGKVNVSASLTLKELYSPTSISLESGNPILDDTNAASSTNFKNGGAVTVDGNVISVSNLTPGDKATLNLGLANNGNVETFYRLSLTATGDDLSLLNALKVKLGDQDLSKATSYQTGWKHVDFVTTSSDLVIELPTTAGNLYQGKSFSYEIVVEAVQGNAAIDKTAGDSKSVLQLAESKVTTSEGEVQPVTVEVESVFKGAPTGSNMVLELPKNWTSVDNANKDVVVTVDAIEGTRPESSFVAQTGDSVLGSFDIKCFLDGEKQTQFTLSDDPLTFSSFVGTGKTNVKVYYDNVDLLLDDNPSTGYTYDPATGILTFTTNHLSEYVATYKTPKYLDINCLVDGSMETGSKDSRYTKNEVTVYKTLKEATDAQEAKIGLVPGSYTKAGLANGYGASFIGVDAGVNFDLTGSGNIAALSAGGVFENITASFGGNDYHGFQHAGHITFKDSTLVGKLISYGEMEFDGCTFNQTASDYCMWDYGKDLSYKNCTFNCNGKFINVYNEGNGNWKLLVENCTFNSTKSNKAALNIKATCETTPLCWDVTIKNCTVGTPDMFPAASKSDTLVVGSALWQVDDIVAGVASDVTVTVDGVEVYHLK